MSVPSVPRCGQTMNDYSMQAQMNHFGTSFTIILMLRRILCRRPRLRITLHHLGADTDALDLPSWIPSSLYKGEPSDVQVTRSGLMSQVVVHCCSCATWKSHGSSSVADTRFKYVTGYQGHSGLDAVPATLAGEQTEIFWKSSEIEIVDDMIRCYVQPTVQVLFTTRHSIGTEEPY
ncbi:hypothetical protein BR93DRAFT_568097 [Coniochaeta sp. PMI_546]|nr:hypothetical protein BR93DRAFT_568097 [Coniochaeta sp. PMI_546]